MATQVQYADESIQVTDEYPSGLDVGARMHTLHATFVQTAATIADTILEMELPRLLPGKVIVHPQLSWLRADDADTNADLHIGYREYRDANGDIQVADDDYWMGNADVGGGALQGLWPSITGITTAGARPSKFDAQDGLRIVVMVDTAMFNAADVVEVVVVYSHIQ